MKKLVLLLAFAVAFSMTALAQAGTQSSTSETGSQAQTTEHSKKEKGEWSKSAKESQLTGCLAKNAEGNGYMLTNKKYKKGVEIQSSEDLSAHVGHEVKLKGNWEKSSSAEAGGAGPKGHEMRTFNASSVTHVSDTCKMANGEKTEKKSKSATTPGF